MEAAGRAGAADVRLRPATTVVTTYLPVLASTFSGSTTVIGLLIGIEGLMALLLAVPAGSLSDRVSHRQAFIIGGSPVLVLAPALLGFATSLGLAALLVVVFLRRVLHRLRALSVPANVYAPSASRLGHGTSAWPCA